MNKKILVIKLSAMGDFIISLGAMRAIRNHHPDAHITLMTTNPFKNLAEKSGLFDDIWVDSRPKIFNLPRWFQLKKQLNDANFSRVYDLQNNDRTSIYFGLFSPKPEWVGSTKGASHYYKAPDKNTIHAFDEHRTTLKHGGINPNSIKIDRLDWLQGSLNTLILPDKFCLIVPGSAPSRPEKRWPSNNYADLCQILIKKNIIPVLIGTDDESDILSIIHSQCPEALNLAGRTSLFDLPYLARKAAFAVGNDTGPMHMIAPTGCNAVTIFSSHSNPVRSAPMGENVHVIQADNWDDLPTHKIMETVQRWV